HLSQEIFPATYSPSIFRQGEAHHPTRTFFLTNLLAQQIQTPLRSANVCPPILRMRPRLGKQCARQDIFLFHCYRFSSRSDDASWRPSRKSNIDNGCSAELRDRSARIPLSRQQDFLRARWEILPSWVCVQQW